jgi:hypothetical protein
MPSGRRKSERPRIRWIKRVQDAMTERGLKKDSGEEW